MWTPWNIGQPGAMAAAAVFALVLTALLVRLGRAASDSLAPPIEAAIFPQHGVGRYGLPVLSGAFAVAVVWAFGPTPAALAAIVFIAALITLAAIDAHTGLLPDLLTQPLLWLGLLVNLNGAFASLPDAVLGAVAGYLVLWGVYQTFLLFTGREGMGYGDFKLLAAIGAWLGWAALPWILLGSSLLALAVALIGRVSGRLVRGEAMSFGPYLAAAGILLLFALFARP